MDYITYTKKLNTLRELIAKGWVKTPKNISQKLNVTERTALRLIASLKEAGTEVRYSRKERCYKIISGNK